MELYVAAYALSRGASFSRSWIGVFGPEGIGNPYALLASVENSLPNRTVWLQPLSSAGEPEITFLASGINWNDAHNHFTVIAYSFDGKKLEPVWSRVDLPQGHMHVEGAEIMLVFLSKASGPVDPDVQEITEI